MTNQMGGPFIGVDGVTESDMLAGVDPGVSRLVAWLRAHKFDTTDSGDGKTKFAQGFTEDDCVCQFPHVAIVVEPADLVSEADRLEALLRDEHGIKIEPTGPKTGSAVELDASYSVATGTAMLVLVGVDDARLRSEATS